MCPEDSAPSQLRSAKSQPPDVQSPGQVGPVGDLTRPGTQHSPPLPPLPFVRPSSVRDEMDSPDESAAASRHSASSPAREGAEDDVASKKATIRKRTKTGCLTCRKRRIKCDEGRPVCSNCIKSKRQCEGYNQRVIFKDPLGTFAPFGRMSSVVYPQPSPQALVREQQLSVAQQKSSSQSLQIIAPKPPPLGFNHHGAFPPPVALFNGQQVASPSLPLNFDPSLYGLSAVPPTPKYTFSSSEAIGAFPRGSWRHGAQPTAHLEHPSEPLHANLEAASLTADTGHDAHHHVPPDVSLQQSISFLDKGKANAGVPSQLGHWDYPVSEDDDASIAGSDDDTSMGQSELAVPLDDLGLIVSQRAHDRFDLFATQPRTFSVHPDVGVLSSYEADFATSPLLNRQNSVIFWHFVNVTGPSMSMYERNSLDTVPTHQHGTSVQAHRHLWSYIFPILSFSHAALLQAILALGGLQIAKLQGVPPTTSLKHYHLSLRRVARNIGRPNKRAQPANLAATLLLAYYEVWNSDHEKWSKHLLGARWIIRDINFRQMTRHMMKIKERSRLRRSQAAQVQQQQIPGHPFPPGLAATYGIFDSGHTHSHDQHNTEPDPLYSDWDLVNVPLLTIIMGRDVSYQELGVGRDEDFPGYGRWDTLTEKDMERYERFSDLYWWYCKMDVYQSVLGGTKLFMDYDLWTQCPPRAPMGRLDAVYGTYDHLMLLLGRLTNFASRDLPRKRRAFMLKGTFGGNGAPPGSFPGMMPASSRVAMPMGFSPPREGYSPQSDSLDDADLEALTAQAYRDWESIKAAFEAIREHFGSDFQPLAQDLAPMIHTPFGPAAQYRTYSIAGIWMNYYMGLIVLHRAHPEMPPVAMMAAGMSSSDTMGYATEIGRIAAGLEEDLEAKEVISTLVGAAFIECAFPLFVAGVQYQYDPQRHWLVRRMHSIARLTGWQSARQIADGCESAWTKAASMGQGQPYMRAPEMDAMENAMENAMQPVWTTQSRRLDHRIHEVETGEDSSARKIVLAKSEQAHYALGLLGVQEDFELLDLEDAGNEAK